MTREKLLQDIYLHLERSGETRTGFGFAVANDPNLVRHLEGGRDIGLKMIEAINSHILSTRKPRRRKAKAQ